MSSFCELVKTGAHSSTIPFGKARALCYTAWYLHINYPTPMIPLHIYQSPYEQ